MEKSQTHWEADRDTRVVLRGPKGEKLGEILWFGAGTRGWACHEGVSSRAFEWCTERQDAKQAVETRAGLQ